MPRRYCFANLYNARDLGGYATVSGGETQWKRFIRCADTSGLTPREVAALVELGVTDVVDLRGAEEAARAGSALRDVPGLRYANIPLAVEADSMGIALDEARTGEFYLQMAENAPAAGRVFRTLAEARGVALFHCTAGKDRTGIVAALLLLLAGVDTEDIVADYMVSEWYIRKPLAAVRREHPAMPAHFLRSRPAYMEDFLARLLARYGSAEGYFAAMGLEESAVARLKAKLLDPEWEK